MSILILETNTELQELLNQDATQSLHLADELNVSQETISRRAAMGKIKILENGSHMN